MDAVHEDWIPDIRFGIITPMQPDMPPLPSPEDFKDARGYTDWRAFRAAAAAWAEAAASQPDTETPPTEAEGAGE